MQVFTLDIIECWFVWENDAPLERKTRLITTWTDKEDALDFLMKWIEKNHYLDSGLVLMAQCLNSSEKSSDEKFSQTIRLFNRFSKFAAELNCKSLHFSGEKKSWAEISIIENKLRGSAFE